jgi:anti-anti-sigma factor
MELSSQQIADVTLIHVKGRVDHKTAKDFEDGLAPLMDACVAGEFQKILIDLGDVEFMTSAGLRVLMIAAKTCDKDRGQIVVADLQPIIEEIFKISRFDLVLKVCPTVSSALEALSPAAADAYGKLQGIRNLE